ncbi:MAG TPA: type II toxin-antitoxin system PemK/MazF family toxin [Bryobacteraceae bacterium]|nr:type II toxin-antitoxin system PemK/MazF family toxin [Bryobacteraceae bacterium]
MDVQQGDIYWIDIPSNQAEGSEQFGKRPFVVVSRTALNRQVKTVIVVPMTTFGDRTIDAAILSNQPPFRIVIPVGEITKDASCNTQLSVSVAKTDQARVVDKSRLQQRIGRLSQTAVIAVSVGLAFVFDIR